MSVSLKGDKCHSREMNDSGLTCPTSIFEWLADILARQHEQPLDKVSPPALDKCVWVRGRNRVFHE